MAFSHFVTRAVRRLQESMGVSEAVPVRSTGKGEMGPHSAPGHTHAVMDGAMTASTHRTVDHAVQAAQRLRKANPTIKYHVDTIGKAKHEAAANAGRLVEARVMRDAPSEGASNLEHAAHADARKASYADGEGHKPSYHVHKLPVPAGTNGMQSHAFARHGHPDAHKLGPIVATYKGGVRVKTGTNESAAPVAETTNREYVLHHEALEPHLHAALRATGGKSLGKHKTPAGETVHHYSVPAHKHAEFTTHYNTHVNARHTSHGDVNLGHHSLGFHDDSLGKAHEGAVGEGYDADHKTFQTEMPAIGGHVKVNGRHFTVGHGGPVSADAHGAGAAKALKSTHILIPKKGDADNHHYLHIHHTGHMTLSSAKTGTSKVKDFAHVHEGAADEATEAPTAFLAAVLGKTAEPVAEGGLLGRYKGDPNLGRGKRDGHHVFTGGEQVAAAKEHKGEHAGKFMSHGEVVHGYKFADDSHAHAFHAKVKAAGGRAYRDDGQNAFHKLAESEAPEAEPSFMDRVMTAAGAVATKASEALEWLVVGAASAAFALVDSVEVSEAGPEDHVVHVNYKLHSGEQAKATVHHLIHHAIVHGAHSHDAEGYDGHVALHFKQRPHAEAFKKLASRAAAVHKVVHHEPAHETVLLPEGAGDVKVIPTVPFLGNNPMTRANVRLTTDMGAASITLETLVARYGAKQSTAGGYDLPWETAQAFLNEYMANGGTGYIVVPRSAANPDGKAGPNEAVARSAAEMAQMARSTMNAKAGLLRGIAAHTKNSAKALSSSGAYAVNSGLWPSSLPRPDIMKWTHADFEAGAKAHEKRANESVEAPAAPEPEIEGGFVARVMAAANAMASGVEESAHAEELATKAKAAGFAKSVPPGMHHIEKGGRTVTVQANAAGVKVAVHHKQVGTIAVPSRAQQHPTVDAALAAAKAEHEKPNKVGEDIEESTATPAHDALRSELVHKAPGAGFEKHGGGHIAKKHVPGAGGSGGERATQLHVVTHKGAPAVRVTRHHFDGQGAEHRLLPKTAAKHHATVDAALAHARALHDEA